MPVTTRQGRSDLKRIRQETDPTEPPKSAVAEKSKKSRHHASSCGKSELDFCSKSAPDEPQDKPW